MANVKITITNAETNLARTITTNDSGQYVAVDLRIGHYSVKAEASGFKVAEEKGLVLNGGEDDDRGGAGGMSIAPSLDAIAEFRALTSNYSADYGLSSGGTMTMVLKSGSSTLHASAWEFHRNDALDARGFFNPGQNLDGSHNKVAKLRLNVFGFNVGGPVTFGKLYNRDKKRTFFFYNMEWRRLIQGNITNGQTVPVPG